VYLNGLVTSQDNAGWS